MADLGSRTARAAVWSLLATIGTRLISLVSLAILARLLAPRDFGLLAFALVYITYVETIGDLGSSLALIYWPDRKDDAAQITFWVNLASGFGWFFLTLLVAPAIAGFFNSADGTGIVRLLAWSFPIKSLGNTHDALAQKELRFRARLFPELGLAGGKALLSIALARAGLGAWSLAYGHLAGMTCWTAMLWLAVPWRPRLRFPKELLRPMLNFGRGMVTVNVLAAVVHHIDLAIVGRMLGAVVLGVYQMGSRVPDMTLSVIIWVAGRVLFPAFAAVHAAGEDLKNAYLTSVRYMSLLTVPVATVLFVTAEPLVLALFGKTWTSAIPILRAMAIYSGLRALGSPAGDLLKAIGRADLLAKLAIVKAAILIPALIAAGTRDATTVAVALVAVTGLTTLLNLGVAAVRLPVRVSEIGAAMRVSLIGGVALAATTMLLRRVVHGPAVVEVLILAAAGAAAYLATIALLDRNVLHEAREKLLTRSSPQFTRFGRFLVPRDVTIRRYFAENLYVTHRTRERMMRTMVPGLLLGARGGVESIEEIVPPDATGLLAKVTAGTSFRPIVVSDYHDGGRSRAVLFLFAENQSQPSAVAKLRPLSGSGVSLEHEYDALRFVETLPQDVRETVPKPLQYERSATYEALLLSHLPGRSAYLEMHGVAPARHVDKHFDAAARWLARFHAATRAGAQSAVHGDFWARNLLIDAGTATGVVDWEHFSRLGSPFEDLFHFPLSYALSYWRRTTPLGAFRKTFIDDTAPSAAVRRYLQRYCTANGHDISACGEWFETYLSAKGGQESRLPWLECLQILRRARRSVFSG